MEDEEQLQLVKKLLEVIIILEPKMASALRFDLVVDYVEKHNADDGTAVEKAMRWASENKPEKLDSIDLMSLGLGILVGAALSEEDNKPL